MVRVKVVPIAAVLLAVAGSQGDSAGAAASGSISRRSIDGAAIGMKLADARALWGKPSGSFVKSRGVTYVWPNGKASIRFKHGRANQISVVVTGSALRTRYGDRAGSRLAAIKAHFPHGIKRRTCCWRDSYAVAAKARGYMLAFTFNSGGGLELVELVDKRSYLTCFHTARCD